MATPSRPALNPAILLLPAGISLLAGINAGLLLGDLVAPLHRDGLAERHGILMVLGFLGTLISLERAVALRHPWGYAAPALLGAGGVVLAVGGPQRLGTVLLIDGALVFVAVYAVLFGRQRDEATAVGGLAAVAALVAAVLWLRLEVFDLLPWLATFVILTICAERVELARLHRPPGSERILLVLSSAVFAAAALTLLVPALGIRAYGVAVLVLAIWTASGDVARHTVRATGLPRYSAAAMLFGYAWLMVAALTWAVDGVPGSRATYDIVVHAVFLGFAMSMVLAHAPIILPAVIRRPLPYHPVLWVLLLFLQVSLAARLVLGGGVAPIWRLGAYGTAAALVLLPVTALSLVVIGSRRARRPQTPRQTAST